jgi:hypothetical protein
VGASVGCYKGKKSCGRWYRLLQRKKLMWVLRLDKIFKKKNPKSRIKWGSSSSWADFLLFLFFLFTLLRSPLCAYSCFSFVLLFFPQCVARFSSSHCAGLFLTLHCSLFHVVEFSSLHYSIFLLALLGFPLRTT